MTPFKRLRYFASLALLVGALFAGALSTAGVHSSGGDGWEEGGRYSELLKRFVAAFPIPPPYSQGGTDEDRRAWARTCAEQFAFSFRGEGWGHKSAHSILVPVSTDSIARQRDGRLYAYDLILAGGADNQRVDFTPDELDITGQYFIPVQEKDHLAGVGGGGPPPEPPMRLGASLFWGLGGERNGWPELEQQLAEYAAHDVDFVRTLVHLNSSDPRNPWKRIGLHAQDPDLEAVIQRYIDRVARHGLKVELTLLGGMADMQREDQQDRFVDRISTALRGRLQHIELIEVMNEYRVNGGSIPVLHRMARRLRGQLGDSFLLALSSPDSVHNGGDIKAEVQAMALHEANAITPHWNRHNHVAPDLGGFAPDFVISNEPRGPSSSVSETDDPAVIERDWNAAKAAGYYAYVLHSDSGVWSIYITDEWKDGTRGIWPIFSTHTNGPTILATVKRLRGSTGAPRPPPPPSGTHGAGVMRPGNRLLPGQRLYSPTGSHYLEYQADANLVIYGPNGPVWSSRAAHEPSYVEMQTDGHFVEYDRSGRPRRATHTWMYPGSAIQLNDDGNFVMYLPDGTPVWASKSMPIYDENGDPITP